MKRLLAVSWLVFAFLGGYYLGRQPDSPDILRAGARLAHKAVQAGRELVSEQDRFEEDQPLQ